MFNQKPTKTLFLKPNFRCIVVCVLTIDYNLKFVVHHNEVDNNLIFYKSPKSNRWFMEVPYPPRKDFKFERHHLVPCNYSDYESAMNENIPDLWWKTYRKLN